MIQITEIPVRIEKRLRPHSFSAVSFGNYKEDGNVAPNPYLRQNNTFMSIYRKYKVIKKVKESNWVVSLYLGPIDNAPLAEFKPGQHLMLRLRIPECEIPVFRYYSFSDNYHPEYYRISIKKEIPPLDNPALPEGLCSSYIYDKVNEGDILEAKGPSGNFFINAEEKNPVVLIAGGIGITPLLSILKTIAAVNPKREVYFFYGINEKCQFAFQNEVLEIRWSCPGFNLAIFCLKLHASDVRGRDFDYTGFINSDTIFKQTRKVNADYYICGPVGMMEYITGELEMIGVAKDKIHIESFASNVHNSVLEKEAADLLNSEEDLLETDAQMTIEFTRSNRKIPWDERYKSILEFAEANDIYINSGCLFGDCGTCLTPIHAGEIRYTHSTMVEPESGKCLPCSCVPISSLRLEV